MRLCNDRPGARVRATKSTSGYESACSRVRAACNARTGSPCGKQTCPGARSRVGAHAHEALHANSRLRPRERKRGGGGKGRPREKDGAAAFRVATTPTCYFLIGLSRETESATEKDRKKGRKKESKRELSQRETARSMRSHASNGGSESQETHTHTQRVSHSRSSKSRRRRETDPKRWRRLRKKYGEIGETSLGNSFE